MGRRWQRHVISTQQQASMRTWASTYNGKYRIWRNLVNLDKRHIKMEHSTLSCGLRTSDVPVCVGGQTINRQFPELENPSCLCLDKSIYSRFKSLDSGKSWKWSCWAGRQEGSTDPRSSPPFQRLALLGEGDHRRRSWWWWRWRWWWWWWEGNHRRRSWSGARWQSTYKPTMTQGTNIFYTFVKIFCRVTKVLW